MPRSKDPRNYGTFYDKLGELMDRGIPEISLTMTPEFAKYHRHNFYAYVNAWKVEAATLHRRKHLTPEQLMAQTEHALRMDDCLRRYLVTIEGDGLEVQLRFILREMDHRQAKFMGELDKLLDQTPGESYEEVKDLLEHRTPRYQAIDGKSVIDKWDKMSGSSVVLEELDTSTVTTEDIENLRKDPAHKDDLSALITASNQPASPTKKDYINLMTAHLKEKDK